MLPMLLVRESQKRQRRGTAFPLRWRPKVSASLVRAIGWAKGLELTAKLHCPPP